MGEIQKRPITRAPVITDGRTDRRTDGRTNGRTNERTDIPFFLPFPKTKPLVPRGNNLLATETESRFEIP